MYKYKVIEKILYDKLYCKELVDLIFKFLYPAEERHSIHIKKEIKDKLSYIMIEKLYLDEDFEQEKKTISRCIICNRIIDTSKKFKFFGYLDCVNHLKDTHKYEETFNQTILNFMSNS